MDNALKRRRKRGERRTPTNLADVFRAQMRELDKAIGAQVSPSVRAQVKRALSNPAADVDEAIREAVREALLKKK